MFPLGWRYFPSRYQIWCKNADRRRNYGPKSKSKMAAVHRLGFVTSSYRTTHEVFSLGHISLLNFMLIRCIVLKIWQFDFLQIWLEMPIHAPKILVLGSEPLNVICHHRYPQKAPPWPKPHLHANFGADWSTGATCARDEGIKKKENKKRQGKKLLLAPFSYWLWPLAYNSLYYRISCRRKCISNTVSAIAAINIVLLSFICHILLRTISGNGVRQK